MSLTKHDFKALMSDLNKELSSSTAYATWQEKFHNNYLTLQGYRDLVLHVQTTISSWAMADETDLESNVALENIVERLFYIISTDSKGFITLPSLVAKLETDCTKLAPEYQENIELYTDMLLALRFTGLFTLVKTKDSANIIPKISVSPELQTELDAKFPSVLPQVGDVVGHLKENGFGLVPGIRFNAKASKRKIPLNDKDREIISIISKQRFKVKASILENMPYYVPSVTKDNTPLTPEEQEYARIYYYRFADLALEADKYDTVIQFPTTVDSRGRFYNHATDPAIRLSLRSPYQEGDLTPFEQQLLQEA